MLDDGEFAVDTARRNERIASVSVVACWSLCALAFGGAAAAIRLAFGCFLPLACIWFPDAMRYFKGPVLGRDYYVREPSHPGVLRIAGWFLITAVPALIVLVLFLRR